MGVNEGPVAPITRGRELRAVDVGPAVLIETRHSPHAQLDRHAHGRACFTYVVGGSFIEDFGHTRHRCHAGTVLYKPAGAVHANRYGHEGARSVIVELTEGSAAAYGDTAVLRGVRRFEGGRMGELARRAFAELRLMDPASPVILDGLVRELLGQALRATRRPQGRSHPAWLRAVYDHLRDHPDEAPSVTELAARAGVHPDHLSRRFKEHYGVLIGEFARTLRLEEAARRLLDTDAPISRIALDLGFSDQSHLTRLFKRHFAITPGRYRAGNGRRSLGPT